MGNGWLFRVRIMFCAADDFGDIIGLFYKIEIHTFPLLYSIVGNPVQEIGVVSQNEHLPDKSFGIRSCRISIVVTNADQLTDNSADDEKRATVHTGHRVVDDHDPVFENGIGGFSSPYLVIEIQKGNKVFLALTQAMGRGVVIADDDIPAFILILVALLPKMEALEARVGQSFVYGKHGGIYSLDYGS